MEDWKFYKDTIHYNKNGKRMNGFIWEVSSYGNVKKNGKLIINPVKIGGFWVYRAVAELFIPNPENKPCVDHIDTNRLNNKVDNLRWVTYSENMLNPITRQHNSQAHIGKHHSEESKRNISNTMKGIVRTEEYCKNLSNIIKETYNNGRIAWNKGKHLSEEHKHNIHLSKTNK